MHHNSWTCALEPRSCSYWSLHTLQPCSVIREATTMRSPRTATREYPLLATTREKPEQQWRPSTARNKKKYLYTHTHTHTHTYIYLQFSRTSLVVQWLRLQASTSGGMGSIPGWGTKIPHACLVERSPPERLCYCVMTWILLLLTATLIHILKLWLLSWRQGTEVIEG